MSYYIYAVYNYVCSSIILCVKFAVSIVPERKYGAKVTRRYVWGQQLASLQLFAVAGKRQWWRPFNDAAR